MNSEAIALLLVREMPYGKYKGRKLAELLVALLPGHAFARQLDDTTGYPELAIRIIG